MWSGNSNANVSRIFILTAKHQRRESCTPVFWNFKLLILPCLYIYQTCICFKSQCDPMRGSYTHSYETKTTELGDTERWLMNVCLLIYEFNLLTGYQILSKVHRLQEPSNPVYITNKMFETPLIIIQNLTLNTNIIQV